MTVQVSRRWFLAVWIVVAFVFTPLVAVVAAKYSANEAPAGTLKFGPVMVVGGLRMQLENRDKNIHVYHVAISLAAHLPPVYSPPTAGQIIESLKSVEGVVRVVVDPHKITIEKLPTYRWDEVTPAIEDRIRDLLVPPLPGQ